MKEYLKHYSLAEIEQAYYRGLISTEDRDEYLMMWNAYPGRFTVARWEDGAIRQREKK